MPSDSVYCLIVPTLTLALSVKTGNFPPCSTSIVKSPSAPLPRAAITEFPPIFELPFKLKPMRVLSLTSKEALSCVSTIA